MDSLPDVINISSDSDSDNASSLSRKHAKVRCSDIDLSKRSVIVGRPILQARRMSKSMQSLYNRSGNDSLVDYMNRAASSQHLNRERFDDDDNNLPLKRPDIVEREVVQTRRKSKSVQNLYNRGARVNDSLLSYITAGASSQQPQGRLVEDREIVGQTSLRRNVLASVERKPIMLSRFKISDSIFDHFDMSQATAEIDSIQAFLTGEGRPLNASDYHRLKQQELQASAVSRSELAGNVEEVVSTSPMPTSSRLVRAAIANEVRQTSAMPTSSVMVRNVSASQVFGGSDFGAGPSSAMTANHRLVSILPGWQPRQIVDNVSVKNPSIASRLNLVSAAITAEPRQVVEAVTDALSLEREFVIKEFRNSVRVLDDRRQMVDTASVRTFIMSNEDIVRKHFQPFTSERNTLARLMQLLVEGLNCYIKYTKNRWNLINALTGVPITVVKALLIELNPCGIRSAVDLFIMTHSECCNDKKFVYLGGSSVLDRRMQEQKRLLNASHILSIVDKQPHDMIVFAEMVGIAYLHELQSSQDIDFEVVNSKGVGYDSIKFMTNYNGHNCGCYMLTTNDPSNERNKASGPLHISKQVDAQACSYVSLHGDRSLATQLTNIVRKSKVAKRTNVRCAICNLSCSNSAAMSVHVVAAHKLVGCCCKVCKKPGSFSQIVNHLIQTIKCVPNDMQKRPDQIHSFIYYRPCIDIPSVVSNHFGELVNLISTPIDASSNIDNVEESNVESYKKNVHGISVSNNFTTQLLCYRGDGGNSLSNTPVLWFYYNNWIMLKLDKVAKGNCKCQYEHHYVCTNEYIYTWKFNIKENFTQLPAQVCKLVNTERSNSIAIPFRSNEAKCFHITGVERCEKLLSDNYERSLPQFPAYIDTID